MPHALHASELVSVDLHVRGSWLYFVKDVNVVVRGLQTLCAIFKIGNADRNRQSQAAIFDRRARLFVRLHLIQRLISM